MLFLILTLSYIFWDQVQVDSIIFLQVSAATFLDVATLRCLFTSQWQEEGVYWALHYLYNR